jgi:hypothetical protein
MRVLTVPGLDHQAAVSPADQPVKKTKKYMFKGTASPEYQKLQDSDTLSTSAVINLSPCNIERFFRRLDIHWELKMLFERKCKTN